MKARADFPFQWTISAQSQHSYVTEKVKRPIHADFDQILECYIFL